MLGKAAAYENFKTLNVVIFRAKMLKVISITRKGGGSSQRVSTRSFIPGARAKPPAKPPAPAPAPAPAAEGAASAGNTDNTCTDILASSC